MKEVAIFMEGGSKGEAAAALRRGMNTFLSDLKKQAEAKGVKWTLVPCGSRDHARGAFLNARKHTPDVHAVLLVDAEAPVTSSPKQHLTVRDKWQFKGVPQDAIHLMVQVMETWLVADPDALAGFYGHKFNAGALPKAQNMETVSKRAIRNGLERATQRTQKGRYHKIRHASRLLELIKPETVRARCRHCARLFETVGRLVA